MDETKAQGQRRHEMLSYKSQNAWEEISDIEKIEVIKFCESYKEFLNKVKTEREFITIVEDMAIQKGFISFDKILSQGINIEAGMKIYYINRNKYMIIAVIGKESPSKGVNIIGSHIDSPRIDIKQNLLSRSKFATKFILDFLFIASQPVRSPI